jgi:hypothetical protein
LSAKSASESDGDRTSTTSSKGGEYSPFGVGFSREGFPFADVADGVVWCFEVPALADPDDLGSLSTTLRARA